jgi:hypothetical protein
VVVGERVPKRKNVRAVLLRYIPIAACLAVILLAIPRIVNITNRNSSFPAPPAAVREAAQMDNIYTQKDMVSGSGNNMADGWSVDAESESMLSENGDASLYRSDNPSAPTEVFKSESDKSSAPAGTPAPMPAPASAPEIVYPAEPQDSSRTEPIYGSGPNSGSAPESPNATADVSAPDEDSDRNTHTITGENDASENIIAQPPSPMEKPAPVPDALNGTSGSGKTSADGSADSPAPSSSIGNQENIAEYASNDVLGFFSGFSDAYVWIEITGELPALLKTYDPVPVDSLINWESYYEIPRSAAQELIKKISASDGVSITYNNNDGRYAIVLYSSGS